MTDIASTARTARESLSRGLSALQSDPSLPPHLLDLAAPIAQAMGALHQIERNNGAQLSPHAETALNNVRQALSQLQGQPVQVAAVQQAMEAVAGSLAMVHALNKLAGPAQQPQQPAFPQPQAPPAYAATAMAPPQQQYGPPPQQPQQQQWAPPPQAAGDPFAARSPMAATAVAPAGGPYGGQGFGQQPGGSSKAPPAPAMPTGDVQVVNADLGAHSPSNFYKGLSGNDVIDHGGLFVSTYMIPKIGTSIRLRVALPGGYEFEANAIVRWAREQGGDAPPGFGAQFTQITPEARQLVYRYVRNREPLFHDDL